MHDLNDLYYFVQAIDHGGFAAAGRELGIPKSKLSRRVAELEDRLGVRLIQRSSRRFHATEVGEMYYRHCKAMLVEANAAQEAIEAVHAEPCGIVRLSCPTALLQAHVSSMLADFLVRYPQVSIQLQASNRRVDLINEGLDIAIRVRPPPLEDSELILRILSDRGQCIVASPKLTKQYSLPQSPHDLAEWPSLALGKIIDGNEWHLQKDGESLTSIQHPPRLATTDMATLRTAALAGVGIAQLPRLMVESFIRNGELIELLPEWEPPREIIHCVFPSRRGLLPSVRSLIDHLANSYAEMDEN